MIFVLLWASVAVVSGVVNGLAKDVYARDYLDYSTALAAPATEVSNKMPGLIDSLYSHLKHALIVGGAAGAGYTLPFAWFMSIFLGVSAKVGIAAIFGYTAHVMKKTFWDDDFKKALVFAAENIGKLTLHRDPKVDEVERFLNESVKNTGDPEYKRVLVEIYKPASANLRTYWSTKVKLLTILATAQVCTKGASERDKILANIPERKRKEINASLSECARASSPFMSAYEEIVKCATSLSTGSDNLAKDCDKFLPRKDWDKCKSDPWKCLANSKQLALDAVTRIFHSGLGTDGQNFAESLREGTQKLEYLDARDRVSFSFLDKVGASLTKGNLARAAVAAGTAYGASVLLDKYGQKAMHAWEKKRGLMLDVDAKGSSSEAIADVEEGGISTLAILGIVVSAAIVVLVAVYVYRTR